MATIWETLRVTLSTVEVIWIVLGVISLTFIVKNFRDDVIDWLVARDMGAEGGSHRIIAQGSVSIQLALLSLEIADLTLGGIAAWTVPSSNPQRTILSAIFPIVLVYGQVVIALISWIMTHTRMRLYRYLAANP